MQNVEKPLVSIALCTYNGERFLTKQLDSLLCQEYDYLEIIVVDDYSNDATLAILEDYAKKDNRIKLFRNEQNLGYTKNFEKALKLCTGKYIAFADQDDIWEKDKISILVKEIKGHDMVYHNSDYIDTYDQPIGENTVASMFRVYDGPSCLPFILSNCVHAHAVLFDRKLKTYLFPFNEKFSHDWWLAYVAFNVGSVKYLDKVLVHYRQHQNSVTDTFNLQHRKNMMPKTVKGLERISLDLDLVKYCAEFKYNKNAEFMEKTYNMFSNLAQGKEKIKGFWFLLKYSELLFYMRYQFKSYPNKVNFIRKLVFD